ncbi:MAG: 50S ribosomal protein L25 [Balneolales bacterium]|nr:50S ribosomal protein L25 [Balneolales bacterium]
MKKPAIVEIEVSHRTVGTTSSKKLRDELLVPAIIYGPGVEENMTVALPEIELEKRLSVVEKEFLHIKVDGKVFNCIIQDVEFHPVTDRPIHVDLYATNPDKPVIITVPIRLDGKSPGVAEGGRLYQPLRELQIKCLPENVPAEFAVNISKLQIGNSLKVRRIKSKDLEILTSGQRTIVVIRPPKGASVAITELEDDEDEETEEVAAEA